MLFSDYLHGLVARHGSHVMFYRLFVCVFEVSSELYRLKQFLEKETTTFFFAFPEGICRLMTSRPVLVFAGFSIGSSWVR